MKKIILALGTLASIAAANANAASTAVCTGVTGTKVTVAAGTDFVKTTFTTPCSTNVFLNYDQSTTAAWVVANSKKGACFQIGHTDAGVKAMTPTCSAAAADAGITAADTGTGLTAAQALGSS